MTQRVPDSVLSASTEELVDVTLDVLETKLPEKIPADLHGHVFVIGPVGSVESNGLPSPNGVPIFNGNGMIFRVDFDKAGEARLSTKLARTPCYYADLATLPGSRFNELRFCDHGLLRFSVALGLRNELNTAFQPIFQPGEQPRLCVTYDAGKPYEIDTQTLDLVTPVGRNEEWRPALPVHYPFPMVLSTAHPYFDPATGEFLSVNFGRSIPNLLLGSLPLSADLRRIPASIDRLAREFGRLLDRALSRTMICKIEESIKKFLVSLFPKNAGIPWFLREGAPLGPEQTFFTDLADSTQNDFVHIIRWDGKGALEHHKLVMPDGEPVRISQSMHQIGVTRNYIVLADTAFKIGVESIVNSPYYDNPGIEHLFRVLLTRPQDPETVLYLVPRAGLKEGGGEVTVRRLKVELETIHFLTDYDDTGDRITLLMAHNCAADVGEWIRGYDLTPGGKSIEKRLFGMLSLGQNDVNRLGRYTIDAKTGEIVDMRLFYDPDQALGIGLYAYQDVLPSGALPEKLRNVYWQGWGLWPELSTRFIDGLYEQYPRRLLPLSKLEEMRTQGGQRASVLRFDFDEMKIADRYEMPESTWLSSMQFVPRKGTDGKDDTKGYVVTTVNTNAGSELWVFDGQNLSQGPVCRLGHPKLNFGVTIHTAWLPTIGPRTASYHVSAKDDFGPTIAKTVLPSIKELFEQEIYPRFP